jgi:hypothetical protein
MQLVMLKCVGVLDVVQVHELIYVQGVWPDSCGWVFVIVEIAKFMTSGFIEREIRVS